MPRPLVEYEDPPARIAVLPGGGLLLDYARAAFGTLLVPSTAIPENGSLVLHLGEKLLPDGRLDREPPGCIRYVCIVPSPDANQSVTRIRIPPDTRNTGPLAIKMPERIGEVFPFRYVEIEGAGALDPATVRRVRVQYPFDDAAAGFASSDPVLCAVWDLCAYSIKATTFCGVYVDGDRERIPYEGDAYIQQLGHYCLDTDTALARYSHEYLLQHPTWPTDWQLHSVPMAWMDYLYSGQTDSLQAFYPDLCAKTLIELARPDGLICVAEGRHNEDLLQRLHFGLERDPSGQGIRDLVDWPPARFAADGGSGERDGHEMCAVNTVINALHVRALRMMSGIARALGQTADAKRFRQQAELATATINRLLYDAARGVYVDGEGAGHASLHSNMFMLAFELVPAERVPSVLAFVKSRGMACSVYGAQYLLEALYLHGEAEYALALLTARHDRSWWHMIELGSTMTLEAWDLKYKGNLDWNHAWGAVPANIIPRYLVGIRPLEPGFRKVLIQPQPATLRSVTATHPSPLGPIRVQIEQEPGQCWRMDLALPPELQAEVRLPPELTGAGALRIDGESADVIRTDGTGGRLEPLTKQGPGRFRFEWVV